MTVVDHAVYIIYIFSYNYRTEIEYFFSDAPPFLLGDALFYIFLYITQFDGTATSQSRERVWGSTIQYSSDYS